MELTCDIGRFSRTPETLENKLLQYVIKDKEKGRHVAPPRE
jgi:hypothetical protein